jgi:hypothetical protein
MGKVLLVGLGDVGTHMLEFLARDPKCPELVVCDINEEVCSKRVNNALIGAAVAGLYPTMTFRKLDLSDVEGATRLIKEVDPEVVINSTVMQTWHVIRKLPDEVYAKVSSASLGAWLPCQLGLSYKLMLAIKQSGLKPHVINTSLSCMTNPALAKVGLAPTIGIGNVELIAPAVRVLVHRRLNVPMDSVKAYLICHHVWWVYPREAGYKKGPFYLKAYVNDKDVTGQLGDLTQFLYDSIKLYPPGIDFTTVSANSTIESMYALMSPSGKFKHAPGPKGLSGGYPIEISNKGVDVVLPAGITLEEAIKINEDSNKIDGIDHFEEGGRVVYSDYTHKILKETIGFDCKSFMVQDSYDVAKEMIKKYREFAAQYGVHY